MPIYKRFILSIIFIFCFSTVFGGGIYSYFYSYKNPIDAIKAGDYEATKSLIENGASIEGENKIEETLVMAAVDQGSVEIVELLAEHGASLDGMLHRAPTIEIAECLIKKGCKVNDYDKEGMTPLMKVNLEVAKFLIDQGAKLERKNNDGLTPLGLAASQEKLERCAFFIDHGCNLEAQDNLGRTPLSLAVDKRQGNIVKFLISKGANVNATDDTGMTPLMHSAVRGNVAITSDLLEGGADRDAKTTHCTTYEERNFYPYSIFPKKTTIPTGSTAAEIAKIFSNRAVKELIEESR